MFQLKVRSYLFFKDFILFIFRERGREAEREGDKHQCVVASSVSSTGDLTWPATKACALTGTRTSNTSVSRPELDPLSHTSQGRKRKLLKVVHIAH